MQIFISAVRMARQKVDILNRQLATDCTRSQGYRAE